MKTRLKPIPELDNLPDEKRDLLILVTPHIIDDGAPIPGASNPIPPATR